jgi:DNA-binding SARP family transcriptional activator
MDLKVRDKKYCILYLLIFVFPISIQIVNAQMYGLEFQGYDFTLDKRTELDLTPDKLLKFKNEFEISFYYKAIRKDPNSFAGLFGYIFRIIDSNNENIDLLSAPTAQTGLNLVLGKSDKIIPLKFSFDTNTGWTNLRIKFFLEEDKLIFFTPDTSYVEQNVGFKKDESFKIIFGANDFKQFKSSDVPSMAIKDIVIYENDKIKHHWPLDETNGFTAKDRIKGENARVINPSWLVLTHQNWQKVYEDNFNGIVLEAADNENGDIFIVGKDLLTVYSTKSNNVSRIKYKNNPLFFDKNYRAVFNTNDKKIYCYVVDGLPFYSLNMFTGEWNDSGTPITFQTKYRHHNSLYRAKDNSVYTFGGYGGHRYNNEIYKFDLNSAVRKEIPVNKSVFQPRYLSGSGELNDTMYILGGYGSESGNQLINPHSYFDLIAYSFQSGELFEKFHIPVLIDDMVIGNRMWINAKTREYYALIFSKVKFENNLQLIKGSIDSPEVESVGDKIPFKFFDARTFVNLFYMPLKDKLYAYISYSSDSTTQVSVYSLNNPPNKSVIDTLPQKEKKWIIIFVVAAILLITGVLVFLTRKSKNRNITFKNKSSNNPLKGWRVQKSKNQVETFNYGSNYNMIFFGGFQVFDKNLKDITNKFSPILKELFVLILLNSIKNNKGISSEKIIEILWSDKSETSARNNRSVYISKLKALLQEIGECELTKETGYWKINFSDTEVKSDYLEFLKITSSKKNLDKQKINRLIEITQKGAFLFNLQHDWLDEFKAIVSDRIIDTLVEFGQSVDVKTDADFIIHLADSIFTFDLVNEEAMILKSKAQYCQGKHSHAKATYEKFSKEYFTMYGEEYDRPFHDIIKS